jgi:hypothetical protein
VVGLSFEEVVREATVLDLGRKGELLGAGGGADEVGDGTENAGCDGERFDDTSEEAECDLPAIGTMRFCMFEFVIYPDSMDSDRIIPSGGISSAAGIGIPRPAATS